MFVDGEAGAVYGLLSDAAVVINSRFIHVGGEHIHCPQTLAVTDSTLSTFCTNHTGTYIGEVGIRTSAGDHVVVSAGTLQEGFASVVVNGHPLVGDSFHSSDQSSASPLAGLVHQQQSRARLMRGALQSLLGVEEGKEVGGGDAAVSLSVQRLSPRAVHISAGLYSVTLHNMDHYLDIAQLNVTDWSSLLHAAQPEGIIGRTWEAAVRLALTDEEVNSYKEKDGNLVGCRMQQQKHCSTA